MKGHIRERSPGHWAIILDAHDPATGKRKRKWHSFKGTKREAQVECSRLITAMSGGSYVEISKLTVSNWITRWLEAGCPRKKAQAGLGTHPRALQPIASHSRAAVTRGHAATKTPGNQNR